jgi:hypothetical protein
MQIGMIGLGRMGGNISRRLMKAGHHCVVFDTNAKPREALAGEGATAAGSLAEMIRRSRTSRVPSGLCCPPARLPKRRSNISAICWSRKVEFHGQAKSRVADGHDSGLERLDCRFAGVSLSENKGNGSHATDEDNDGDTVQD